VKGGHKETVLWFLLLLCSFAAKLAELPRLALEPSKMLINLSQELDLATGSEFEAHTFAVSRARMIWLRKRKPFLEKRKKNFSGN